MMNKMLCAVAGLFLGPLSSQPLPAQQQLDVVTTLTTYASLAREVVGSRAVVEAIARGDQDPHFVDPRPSYAAMMQRADALVSTGLDLELWLPALLDRANNRKVVAGATGHIVAYTGIELLEVPASLSRAGGDIHIYGNPHIHTDPVNAVLIARNIAAGLKRVDPSGGATYDKNLEAFEDRLARRLFGDSLVTMLGRETLFDLARTGRFWSFVREQSYRGRPLLDYVGGWLAAGEPFRGKEMVCYHKNWAYFEARFQVRCAMFVEPKPGIPPSPGHVRDVIEFMQNEHIAVLFSPNYYSRAQVERVASRTGAKAVLVPLHEGGEEGIDDYFALVDLWVTRLADAFRHGGVQER